MIATEAVDGASGGSGGGTQVETGQGRSVLAKSGAGDELGDGVSARIDIAANEIGVPLLHVTGGVDCASEDAAAEAGSETLDLIFHLGDGGAGPAIGDVAVGPGGVLSGRSASRVEERGLDEQDKGLVGRITFPGAFFGGTNFFERAAQVYRYGLQAFFCAPRDGGAESPIDLEGAGAIAEIVEQAEIEVGKAITAERGELARRDVAEFQIEAIEFGQIGHRRVRI